MNVNEALTPRLLANRQRRSRETILGLLPGDVSVVLASSEVILAPESAAIERQLWPFARGRSAASPSDYVFQEFERKDDLLIWMTHVRFPRSTDVGHLYLGKDRPVFRVSFDWAIEHCEQFVTALGLPCWLSTLDVRRGLAIDSYGDGERCELFQASAWGAA